jgi:hypothetical protein
LCGRNEPKEIAEQQLFSVPVCELGLKKQSSSDTYYDRAATFTNMQQNLQIHNLSLLTYFINFLISSGLQPTGGYLGKFLISIDIISAYIHTYVQTRTSISP